MHARLAFAICLLMVLFPIVSHGEVWGLEDDFSATQNPNGAWSYGWRAVPSQPLTLYTDTHVRCEGDFDGWLHNIYEWDPTVNHNPHSYPVTCGGTLQPHQVGFHPGPSQQCVVRWTASGDMAVVLTVHFASTDHGSKIVHVYHNGTQLFSATLDYVGQTADYSTTIAAHVGDVVDCAISPISFFYDSTQLAVVLETTEPVPVAGTTWGQVKAIFR